MPRLQPHRGRRATTPGHRARGSQVQSGERPRERPVQVHERPRHLRQEVLEPRRHETVRSDHRAIHVPGVPR